MKVDCLIILFFVLRVSGSETIIVRNFEDESYLPNDSTTFKMFSKSNVQREVVPDFMNDELNERDLIKLSREIILKEFHPMEISFYLNDYNKSNMVNFACIVKGMINLDRKDLVEELMGLWGYYLSLQDDQACLVAEKHFNEIRTSSFFEPVFPHLFEQCRLLNILGSEAKMTLIKLLNQLENNQINLNFDQLCYLYEMDKPTLKKVLCRDAVLKEYWNDVEERGCIDVAFVEHGLSINHK